MSMRGEYDFDKTATITVQGEVYDVPDFVIEEPNLGLDELSPAVDAETAAGAPLRDSIGYKRPNRAGSNAMDRAGNLLNLQGSPGTDGRRSFRCAVSRDSRATRAADHHGSFERAS